MSMQERLLQLLRYPKVPTTYHIFQEGDSDLSQGGEAGIKGAKQSYGFVELLKLNKPDWIFVMLGVVFSVLIGCLFPVMAVPFSEVYRVGAMTFTIKHTLSILILLVIFSIHTLFSQRTALWPQ